MNVEQFGRIAEEYGKISTLYSRDEADFDDFAEFVTICLDYAGRKICDKYVEMILSFKGELFELMDIVIRLYNEIQVDFKVWTHKL